MVKYHMPLKHIKTFTHVGRVPTPSYPNHCYACSFSIILTQDHARWPPRKRTVVMLMSAAIAIQRENEKIGRCPQASDKPSGKSWARVVCLWCDCGVVWQR